jgi:hypothetical protein
MKKQLFVRPENFHVIQRSRKLHHLILQILLYQMSRGRKPQNFQWIPQGILLSYQWRYLLLKGSQPGVGKF